MTDSQFANLHSTHDKIIGNCNFTETDFVCPGKLIPTSAVESNIDMDHGIDANKNYSGRSMQNRCPKFPNNSKQFWKYSWGCRGVHNVP